MKREFLICQLNMMVCQDTNKALKRNKLFSFPQMKEVVNELKQRQKSDTPDEHVQFTRCLIEGFRWKFY